MREASVELVEELLHCVKYPYKASKKKREAAIKRAVDWLQEKKAVVCVERVIRYTGSQQRMERQLEGSIAKDNPKEFNGMRIEEISRVVVE